MSRIGRIGMALGACLLTATVTGCGKDYINASYAANMATNVKKGFDSKANLHPSLKEIAEACDHQVGVANYDINTAYSFHWKKLSNADLDTIAELCAKSVAQFYSKAK